MDRKGVDCDARGREQYSQIGEGGLSRAPGLVAAHITLLLGSA